MAGATVDLQASAVVMEPRNQEKQLLDSFERQHANGAKRKLMRESDGDMRQEI